MQAGVLTGDGERVRFEVHVQPRASRTEVVGLHGQAVKIRLQAPPIEGRANAALLDFLAERLGVSSQAVELVSGHGSRTKRVAVRGLTPEAIWQRLGLP